MRKLEVININLSEHMGEMWLAPRDMVIVLISRSFTRSECWGSFHCSWSPRGTNKPSPIFLSHACGHTSASRGSLLAFSRCAAFCVHRWPYKLSLGKIVLCVAQQIWADSQEYTTITFSNTIHLVSFGLEQKLNSFEPYFYCIIIWYSFDHLRIFSLFWGWR